MKLESIEANLSISVVLQELWNHKELAQVDSAENGEVLSIVCFKDKFFSGHSDGTIKVTLSSAIKFLNSSDRRLSNLSSYCSNF